MNKLLKALNVLVLGLSLVSLSANALEIRQNEIGDKFLMVCNAGHVNSANINRCLDGFSSVDIKDYVESKDLKLDSYEVQISQGLVYIVMKVSK